MADVDKLDYTGLQTKDNTTLTSDVQNSLQTIYGVNGDIINFDSNTPDGNFSEILAEIGTVVRELITEVYNSTDPSKCSGAVQDSRYQINYLTRKSGTFTRQNIAITTNKTVTLQGLDASYSDPNASSYAVSDDAGNIYYLIDTTTLYAGTTQCPFRAKNLGLVTPTIGTITNPVTIVGGVTNVINNLGYTILGTEQESDAEFRIRRERSVANTANNNVDTIEGKIRELDGVTNVTVHTNNTSETDDTETLPHYIWVIVGGGANTDIASVIYANLGGAGTRGNVEIELNTISLQPIKICFDRPDLKPLYIRFDLQVTGVGDLNQINMDDIKTYIANNLKYGIGEDVETSKITAICANAVLAQGGGAYAINVEISKGGNETTSIGSSTGITSATTDVITFQAKVADTAGTYTFTFDGTDWKLNNEVVTLSDYGIVVVGTPAENDTVEVVYTASQWVDFIQAETLADEYVTDTNKITITAV